MGTDGSGRDPPVRPSLGPIRRVEGGRQRVFRVRLSAEEEAWLVPRAAALGVSVQRLLLHRADRASPSATQGSQFLA